MPDFNSFGARLTLDITDFTRAASEVRRTINEITRRFRNANAGIDDWRHSIDGVSNKIEELNGFIQVEQVYIDRLNQAIGKNKGETDEQRAALERDTKELENATAKVRRYQTELSNWEKTLSKLQAEEARSNTRLARLTNTIENQEIELAELVFQYRDAILTFGRFSSEARELEDRIEALNNDLNENRSILNSVTGIDPTKHLSFTDVFGANFLGNLASSIAYDGIQNIGRAIRTALETSIEFESRFMDVQKTVDGTTEDFIRLRSELMGLSNTLATPMSDIANIASIAGQMGLDVDQIGEFTRVMIMLGDTTNISAEEAGDSLAKLSNLLNLTTDDYERMGSAIVELGNEFPTTEADIALMSARLAGMAGQVAMTSADILGLANALSAVGLEAEMGGNTISKTMREMLLSIENNSDTLATFARTANMAVDDFRKLFAVDATSALIRFVEGLDDVERNGASATQILQTLNITETRQIDTLLRLAGNSQLLAESISVANDAWDENIALSVEAGKRYDTTESQIQFMKNAWSQVAVEMGDVFSPVIRGVVGWLKNLGQELSGNKGLAEELEVAVGDLRSAMSLYAEAQESAKEATDRFNDSLRLQISLTRQSSISAVTDIYEKQAETIAKYSESIRNSQNRINEEMAKIYGARAVYGEDAFSSHRGLIAEMYAVGDVMGLNLSDMDIFELNDLVPQFRELAESTSGAISEYASRLARDIEEAAGNINVANGSIVDSQSELDRITDSQRRSAQSIMELYIRTGESVATAFLGYNDELYGFFSKAEEAYSEGMANAGKLIASYNTKEELQELYDGLIDAQTQTSHLDEGFWTLEATMNAVVEKAKELGFTIKEISSEEKESSSAIIDNITGGAQGIWDAMVQGRKRENALSAIFGDTIDSSAMMGSLQSAYGELYDYMEALREQYEEAQEAGNSIIMSQIEGELALAEALMKRIESIVAMNPGWKLDNTQGNQPGESDDRNWWEVAATNMGFKLSEKDAKSLEPYKQMVDDVSSYFDQIGSIVFDTIDSWYDRQISAIEAEAKALEEALEKQQDMLDYQANARQAQLNEQLENGAITEEEYNEMTAQNKSETEAKKQEAEEATMKKKEELQVQADEIGRKQFEAQKANEIANVWVQLGSAIMRAFSEFGWIGGGIIAALLTAQAGVQTGMIASQQYTPTALAKGGIVTSPTMALIGEDGQEAVVPLENNTEWIAMLADRLQGALMLSDKVNQIGKVSDPAREQRERVNNNSFTQIINSPKALSRKEIYKETRRLFRIAGRS